jgi:hypothetical protein
MMRSRVRPEFLDGGSGRYGQARLRDIQEAAVKPIHAPARAPE